MLLDPTNPDDPPLVTFDQDGRVALSALYERDAEASERVMVSKVVLHLDWAPFVEERQRLYFEVFQKVCDGDKADRKLSEGDLTAKEWLRTVARDLIRLAGEREPYSSAVQGYIRRFRDRDWVKRFVLPHVPKRG